MFTGIVEEIGTVQRNVRGQLAIQANGVTVGTVLGDSIAVNGVCLTVTHLTDHDFTVDVMPETLRRTNLGLLSIGEQVNLERALSVGSRLGGHFVQGHVDGTGRLIALRPEGPAVIAAIGAPQEVMRYIVAKGFIAIDGVSLTVVDQTAEQFTVSLVKHTQHNITLPDKRSGDILNLEVDILGKYVERFVRGETVQSGITESFLAEHGFK